MQSGPETTCARLVVDYAEEAAGHGAVCAEAIISPAETVRRGASWDDLFSGATAGVAEAQERHGVIVRLTPDIPRGFSQEEAEATVRTAARFRDREWSPSGWAAMRSTVP